jgi:signal transduction histidine kinase/tetratricopeptide (TPR) repeat protein
MIENLKIALRKQQKLIGLFLLTIFLPSALLSFFGIRAIRNEHFRLTRQAETDLNEAAGYVKMGVRSRVRAVEDLLQTLVRDSVLGGTDGGATARLLHETLAGDPLVEVVFILEGNGQAVYPLFQPDREDASTRARPLLDEASRMMLSEAERLEFVERDYAAAVAAYTEVLDATRRGPARAPLLSQLARTLVKLGQYHRAIRVYETIQSEHPESRTRSGIPFSLVAQLEKAGCYRHLQEPEKALRAALEAYESIVDDPWGLSESQFKVYATLGGDAVADAVTRYGGNILDGEDYEERVRQVEREHRACLHTWGVIAALERECLPELKRKYREVGSYASGPMRHVSTIDETEYLLTAAMIPGTGEETSWGILGVKLSNEYLEGELLDAIGQQVGSGTTTNFMVASLTGRTITGAPVTSGDFVETTAFFDGNYPPWRIELTDLEVRRSGFPAIHTSFYFWTILTLMGVLVFGVLLVARTVGHEMELLKVKSDFVSSVSHEFKTPLTSIKALTERLLEGKVRHPKKMKEYFSVISQDAERLSRLVTNLLDFSRIEDGRQEYEPVKTNVAEWLGELVSDFRSEPRDRQVSVHSHIPDDLPDLYLDRVAMAQAVVNLLDNAVKFSPGATQVDLIAEKTESLVLIKVRDYGIGIPEDQRAKIFEKFYQGKTAHGQPSRGTGLGLTLVKHAVEGHGGTISVESTVSRGSTFTLSLPITENTARD